MGVPGDGMFAGGAFHGTSGKPTTSYDAPVITISQDEGFLLRDRMLKEKIFVEFNLKIDVIDNLKTTYMIAKLDGTSDEEIFIGAHTDGYFEGAMDNASGIAVGLEMAEYYSKIISTRTYEDRLNTLQNVRKANLKVCCGGILGMGESVHDRIKMLITLANLPKQPESVPLNQLIKIPGTPLEKERDLDPIELIKTIALARILMPFSYVRLSAGRTEMSESTQALAFLAGANSIFQGDVLLTAENPNKEKDSKLLNKLGIVSEELTLNQNA